LPNDHWVIGNIYHAGFYRVNYVGFNNWNLLIKQLKTDHTKINHISRAQLIDDSFNLGRTRELEQTLFLELSEYLVYETSPLVFTAAYNSFDYISEMLIPNDADFGYFKVTYHTVLEKFEELLYLYI
jgi:aminopeptidase N